MVSWAIIIIIIIIIVIGMSKSGKYLLGYKSPMCTSWDPGAAHPQFLVSRMIVWVGSNHVSSKCVQRSARNSYSKVLKSWNHSHVQNDLWCWQRPLLLSTNRFILSCTGRCTYLRSTISDIDLKLNFHFVQSSETFQNKLDMQNIRLFHSRYCFTCKSDENLELKRTL